MRRTGEYKPLSDTTWYKKSQLLNERISSGVNYDYDISRPTIRSKHVKSRPQILYPETSFMDFQKRDRMKLTSNSRFKEKEERAREFLDSLKNSEKSGNNNNKISHKKDYSECLQGDPLYRRVYREQADDDALLGSVSNYLDTVKA